MNKEDIDGLCDSVRECAFSLHQYLRHGHLEKVYENGLVNRLGKRGISFGQQVPVPVMDIDGTLLGNFYADILVESELILELKAVKSVTDEHVAQLLGYLRSSGLRYGLLLNFGASRLYIKRYVSD